jgi:hypothetical protein
MANTDTSFTLVTRMFIRKTFIPGNKTGNNIIWCTAKHDKIKAYGEEEVKVDSFLTSTPHGNILTLKALARPST